MFRNTVTETCRWCGEEGQQEVFYIGEKFWCSDKCMMNERHALDDLEEMDNERDNSSD